MSIKLSFINSENNRWSDRYKLVFNIGDKIDLERCAKDVTFWNLTINNPWMDIQYAHENSRSKLSGSTWDG